MSSPFPTVSLVFIGLEKLLVIFRFVGDGICDSCGKFGCHMKIFLTFCVWFHGHWVNLGCTKITGVFLGEFWIFLVVWLLVGYWWRFFIYFSWRTLGEVGFGILRAGVLVLTTHGG